MSKITEVNKDNFESEVLKSDKAVLVKFYRKPEECRNCAIMESVFEQYAERHPDIKCVQYLCGREQDVITKKYTFPMFPGFIGFINGEPIKDIAIKSLTGIMPESELGDAFKTSLAIKQN